jgi:hypothetical protein
LLHYVLGDREGFELLRKKQIAKSRGVGGKAVSVSYFSSLLAMDLLNPVAGVVAAT